jgi:hypothetical protein
VRKVDGQFFPELPLVMVDNNQGKYNSSHSSKMLFPLLDLAYEKKRKKKEKMEGDPYSVVSLRRSEPHSQDQ